MITGHRVVAAPLSVTLSGARRAPTLRVRRLIGSIPPLQSGVIFLEQRALDPAAPEPLTLDLNRVPGEPRLPSGHDALSRCGTPDLVMNAPCATTLDR
jgi:hypothetical protein